VTRPPRLTRPPRPTGEQETDGTVGLVLTSRQAIVGNRRETRRLGDLMKADIHPGYEPALVRCSCGNSFVTRSTKADLHVELCSECHPFYTGKQKLVDSGGRIEKFERRYGRRKKA